MTKYGLEAKRQNGSTFDPISESSLAPRINFNFLWANPIIHGFCANSVGSKCSLYSYDKYNVTKDETLLIKSFKIILFNGFIKSCMLGSHIYRNESVFRLANLYLRYCTTLKGQCSHGVASRSFSSSS